MKNLILTATLLSSIALSAAADARKAPPPVPAPVYVPRIAPSDPVEAYYFNHGNAPIWTRTADSRAALAALPALLRRAQVEGLANGPALASAVDAAAARAASGSPADVQAAEFAASKAWVAYVQMIKKAPSGMLYGYPHLAPQGGRADQILLTAGAAPNLAEHLNRTAAPNLFYGQLREAAWAGFQANPAAGPDLKLMANMERARVLPSGGRYVLVDAASARLTMFENGRPVDSMKVVVGKQEAPTPMIASMIYYATFNPYWNVPENLIRKNIGPKAGKQGEAYLKSRGYEVISDFSEHPQILPASSVDWKAVVAGTAKVILRQKPGGQNSMGRMKFPFPNREGIYLHDTPTKEYFALANRAKSNGCIRVEDYRRLSSWLFGRDVAASGTAPEQHIALPRGVPVFVTYLTMVPTPTGMASFEDRYGWDRPGVLAGGMDTTVGKTLTTVGGQ